MAISYKDELCSALEVLNAYGQLDSAIWLNDLIACANEKRLCSIHNPVVYLLPSDFKPTPSIKYMKSLYLQQDRVSILQLCKSVDPKTLSSCELFWMSDIVLITWVESKVTKDVNSLLVDKFDMELTQRYFNGFIDPFCVFILGKIWKHKNDNRSSDAFLQSIDKFPYLWSSWLELSSIILDSQSFSQISGHINNLYILKYFFQLYTTNHLLHSSLPLTLYNTLQNLFPNNFHLVLQGIQYYYNHEDYTKVISMLHSISIQGPHASTDVSLYYTLYGNTLYALERTDDLLILIEQLQQRYPLSLELRLLQGSYWSLLGQYEQAMLSFSDLLHQQADCYDGWLLLGHELLNLQKEKQAIAAYQTATRINNRDYRAFFAMSQIYCQSINLSLAYYFLMKSISLQPKMSRLWLALGELHQGQRDAEKALNAWKRGSQCDDSLDTKEGRFCELRCCGVLKEKSYVNCERWLMSVLNVYDQTIGLPEGIEVIRCVFNDLEQRHDYQNGIKLCERIVGLYQEIIAVTEVVGERLQRFTQLYYDLQSVDVSVSMDCSDSFIC